MAANVLDAGFELTVWTHSPGKADRWASEHDGACTAATPAEVARASDIVVSMVVDGGQVESVLCGKGGVHEGARERVREGAHEQLLCVDMSTIAPTDTRRIASRLLENDIELMDAPVTGSAPRAKAGTLTIMVGGEHRQFERATPLLEAMGDLIVHVGGVGQGEMLKLINNSLGAANAAAVAEALLLADATGIDLDALVRVTQSGSGASAQLQMKSTPMREHDYTTLFKTEHLLKDVRLCLEEAQAAGIPFPAAAHARDLLAATVGRGYGQDDYAAIVEAAEGFAGRRLQK